MFHNKYRGLCIKNLSAFTLMEIMVVVVIIGIIAAFAIPNYGKTVNRARERNAIQGLVAIHTANQTYEARNSEVLQGAGLNLNSINSGLNITLRPNDLAYSYSSSSSTDFMSTAQWAGSGSFTARINQAEINLNGNNPCCSAGSCPTLPGC